MEHLINKEGVNRSAEKEAGGRNALNLQMAMLLKHSCTLLRASRYALRKCSLKPEVDHAGYFDSVHKLIAVIEHHTDAPYEEVLGERFQDARAASAGKEHETPAQLPDSSGSSGGGSDGGAEFGEPRGEIANTVPGPMELPCRSRWIETAVQRPTKADGPPFGFVLERWDDGGADYVPVELVSGQYWMPLPELNAPSDPNGLKSTDVSSSQNPDSSHAPESSRDSSSPKTEGVLDNGGRA